MKPEQILKKLEEIEAHTLCINSIVAELKKDLQLPVQKIKKGGLSDIDKAILKKDFYKTTFKKKPGED